MGIPALDKRARRVLMVERTLAAVRWVLARCSMNALRRVTDGLR